MTDFRITDKNFAERDEAASVKGRSNPLRLEVPFVPGDDYLALLIKYSQRIHSLFFSLYSEHGADARHRFDTIPDQMLAHSLTKIGGPRKYALLNSRFLSPDRYFDRDFMKGLAALLGRLLKAQALDGVVFSDAYLLQALSDADPGIMSRLEAVPSINFLPDDFDKIDAVIGMIAGTRFQLPRKIVLDRSLNRRMDQLVKTVEQCRKAFPDMKIGLLANEGCLYQCPFKPAHDAHIALANQTNGPVMTFQTNQDFGCRRVFGKAPWRFLASPFIRPEDLPRYEGIIDFVKLSGRTLGVDFLAGTVTAYLTGAYQGNLFDLMDTTNWMADLIHIPNHLIGGSFFNKVTGCDHRCGACGYCESLYEKLAERSEMSIRDLRW